MAKKMVLISVLLIVSVFGGTFAQERQYRIGSTGPGGGIIFTIEGPYYYEISRVIGEGYANDVPGIVRSFNGGGFNDWYLPSATELMLVYQNLVEPKIIGLGGSHWSSATQTVGQGRNAELQRRRVSLETGGSSWLGHGPTQGMCAVRLIRVFTITQ